MRDRTVSNIIKQFEENGSMKVNPKSGHPRRLMTEMIDILNLLFLSDSFRSSSTLENQRVNVTRVILMAWTVQSYLSQYGLKGSVDKRKPYISETNHLKIPKFAKEHDNRSVFQCRKMVIWFDETRYNMIVPYGVVYFWRRHSKPICEIQ